MLTLHKGEDGGCSLTISHRASKESFAKIITKDLSSKIFHTSIYKLGKLGKCNIHRPS